MTSPAGINVAGMFVTYPLTLTQQRALASEALWTGVIQVCEPFLTVTTRGVRATFLARDDGLGPVLLQGQGLGVAGGAFGRVGPHARHDPSCTVGSHIGSTRLATLPTRGVRQIAPTHVPDQHKHPQNRRSTLKWHESGQAVNRSQHVPPCAPRSGIGR